MSEKVYGICENKCLKEVYTKEDLNKIQEETVEIEGSGAKAELTFKRCGNVVEVKVVITLYAGETLGSLTWKTFEMPEFAKLKNNGQTEVIACDMFTNGVGVSEAEGILKLSSLCAFRIEVKNGSSYRFTGFRACGTKQENDTKTQLKGYYITDVPLEE